MVTSAPERLSMRRERAALVGDREPPPRRSPRRDPEPLPEPSGASRRSGGRSPPPRRARSGRRPRADSGGCPSPVSSPASEVVKQPPCAAASSSSGLVLPSGLPIRDARVKGSSENAPDEPAVSMPRPRARFPSQSISAVRSILGIRRSPNSRGTQQACRQGSTPRPASRRAGRRRAGAARPGPSFSRLWTSRRGRWTQAPGLERRLLAADVQTSRALEDVDHLVVAMEVVGRASGRDVADELRHRRAARVGADPERELTARGRRPLRHRLEVDDGVGRRRRTGSGSRNERPRAARARRRRRSPTRAPPADMDSGAGADIAPPTVDRHRTRAGKDVEHLVRPGGGSSAERPRRGTRECAAQTSRSRWSHRRGGCTDAARHVQPGRA